MAIRGNLPVTEADRDAAATRLREHFAAGRLTLEEFQARLAAIFAATVRRDLDHVTADLPHDGIAAGMNSRVFSAGRGPRPGKPGGRRPRWRRRLRARLLLACAAIVVVWLLIGYTLPHNALLIAAFILLSGLMGLVAGLMAGLFWLGRRAWRHAWLEGPPLLLTMPRLGLARWAAHAAWAGQVRTAARSGTTR
jgi:hypothetical protein